MLETMRVERGTKDDWDTLHSLHYKAESLPAGARYWVCRTERDELVGIVVTSSVSLLLAARHAMMPKLKPGQDTHTTNVHRGKWLNANMRRAARIVTDTLYRGVGVSYRMLNLACRLEGFRFVEIQSSMSKFNPFDAKAGFKHAQLKRAAAYDKGLAFFRQFFDCHPADHEAVLREFLAMPPMLQQGVTNKFREFYYRHSAKEKTGVNLNKGRDKVQAMEFVKVLTELQQLVFASPVYGIYENPDYGRALPASLPLSAFDLQAPGEPLRVDLIPGSYYPTGQGAPEACSAPQTIR